MSNDLPDEIKRWTAPRRAALVLQLLRGETTPNEAARKVTVHGARKPRNQAGRRSTWWPERRATRKSSRLRPC